MTITTMKPYSWVGVHVEGDLMYYDEFPKEMDPAVRRQIHLAELYHERDVKDLIAENEALRKELATYINEAAQQIG